MFVEVLGGGNGEVETKDLTSPVGGKPGMVLAKYVRRNPCESQIVYRHGRQPGGGR